MHIQAVEISFLERVPGFSLRDRMSSAVISEGLRVEAAEVVEHQGCLLAASQVRYSEHVLPGEGPRVDTGEMLP